MAFSLALVFIELKVETPLRVCWPPQRFQGNCEQAITKSADPSGGYCTEPLDYSELRFGTLNLSSLFGWLRVSPSREGRASSRCALRVCGSYSLRGAGGVAAGLSASLSCPQSATGLTAWLLSGSG